jgi:hypothetical protein
MRQLLTSGELQINHNVILHFLLQLQFRRFSFLPQFGQLRSFAGMGWPHEEHFSVTVALECPSRPSQANCSHSFRIESAAS